MNAAERIEALVKHFNTNVKALSELCGYERPQAFYDIQKGKTRNISPTMCDRIMAVFPQLNRVWLLTGDGSITNELPAEASAPMPAVKMVPLVHVSALAGPLLAFHQDGEEYSHNELVVSPTPQAELAVPISGDSMEPVFANGSTAYIAKINEAAFIPWGQPLVIVTENGVFIKNVFPDEGDRAYIWAESINPRYPRMHIPKTSIHSMYRVLSVSKTFGVV